MTSRWDDLDEATLDDVWPELTDDERARAFELLYEPRDSKDGDPLLGYPTPVTRQRKPDATGRGMHDVLPTL
jgi:hypothetical protein